MNFDTDIRKFYGVGEKRAAVFEKLGIRTAEDLLYHFPRLYQDRRPRALCDINDGETAACVMTVATAPHTTLIRRGMSLTKFRAFDGAHSCNITFFNQNYVREVFSVGTSFRFFGKFKKTGRAYSLTSPSFEPLVPGREDALPDRYAVYRLSEGITQNILRRAIADATKGVFAPASDGASLDPIPSDIRHKNGLCPLRQGLWSIHYPTSDSELSAARRRFVFEELFVFSTAVALSKRRRIKKAALPMQRVDMTPFFEALPFEFTEAQRRAFFEIYDDMTRGDHPMNRLLSGDVGSGKTAPAAAAVYVALKNGYSAAIMAPTEILAAQHYGDLAPLFERLGFKCELLVGSTAAAKKRKIKAALCDGTLRFVIGTHALLCDDVVMDRPGLVITDEQHRFGVMQRSVLTEKSESCNTLSMSATPIPRTMALSMFGEVDLSVIDTLPPGRQKVSTFALDESYRSRLLGFIKKQVAEGRQVYIVCPAVEDADSEEDVGLVQDETLPFAYEEKTPKKAAVNYAEQLSREELSGISVEYLHGKMKSREKEAVMRRFLSGETSVLVSTTVIEVGVNVPNATLMIVENAEFFGLSQLHQLRGRVGRGKYKSYCILMSESKTDSARARLLAMCRMSNGFEIAEEDLKLRGPGDFFRSHSSDVMRQHGGLDFKMADVSEDAELCRAAFEASSELLARDPELLSPSHAALRRRVEKMGVMS